MRRIRPYAAGLAWLLLSMASASACQLSVVGPVVQKPLMYNPFQAGTATADISFTVRNGSAKPCDAAFAFFRPGTPQAEAGGGAALTYQLIGASGPIVFADPDPSMALPSGSALNRVAIGAKETVTAHAAISVGSGQVVGPGLYTDRLTLGIYHAHTSGMFKKVAVEPFLVAIGVNAQMTLAVAGGGRMTTLNFGSFVEGAVRSVQLLAYSNLGFHLEVDSDNGGVMKPVDAALSRERWRVPYTIAFNGGPPLTLSQAWTVRLGQGATQKSGLAIPVDVQVGSIKGQRAGFYRDVITIAIAPGV